MAYKKLSKHCIELLVLLGSIALGQDVAPLLRTSNFTLSGVARARVESWDWFRSPTVDSDYTYIASVLRFNTNQSWSRVSWEADASFPLFLNLPKNAVAPSPVGPIGYGGDYFAANQAQNLGAAVLRQGYMTVTNDRWRLRLGRVEFADGEEATPLDTGLATLKRDRINQRLIGTFNYAVRSLDGVEFRQHHGNSTFEAIGGRLVEGSFRLRALSELNAGIGYAAFTRYFSSLKSPAEFRAFVVYFEDRRDTLKADNRPTDQLESDHRPIRLATPGFDYISTHKVGAGAADFVIWAAGQFGTWGKQRHRAVEIAAEAGYKFSKRSDPWLRVGYLHSSGDRKPSDGLHSTFFELLSSPRAYARYPFYVLSNTNDLFLQFKDSPWKRLNLRSELHSVWLSSKSDLWYDGGGPYEESSFGYLGRPSRGKRGVGTSLDFSADYNVKSATTISFYAGVGRGGAVPAVAFPNSEKHPWTHLLSIEMTQRF